MIAIRYPDSDCETHKNVVASDPVCILCLESEISALRERVKELEDAIRKEFPEPDMNAHDGPCCSRFEGGRWVSTGCDCGNSDDTAAASEWRRDANLHLKFKALLSTRRDDA